MIDTALFLLVDGLTNGLVYALLALSLVLVFTVTRVVNIAQGEYVMLGALTLADLLQGRMPGTLYLLIGGLALVRDPRRRPVASGLASGAVCCPGRVGCRGARGGDDARCTVVEAACHRHDGRGTGAGGPPWRADLPLHRAPDPECQHDRIRHHLGRRIHERSGSRTSDLGRQSLCRSIRS